MILRGVALYILLWRRIDAAWGLSSLDKEQVDRRHAKLFLIFLCAGCMLGRQTRRIDPDIGHAMCWLEHVIKQDVSFSELVLEQSTVCFISNWTIVLSSMWSISDEMIPKMILIYASTFSKSGTVCVLNRTPTLQLQDYRRPYKAFRRLTRIDNILLLIHWSWRRHPTCRFLFAWK